MSSRFWDFDTRYRSASEPRRDEAVAREMAQASQAQLARLRRRSNRPEALAYFEGILSDGTRVEELRQASAPKVGTFCNFVPEELIHAAGALPVRLCAGIHAAITPAEEVLPRDICPLVKSTFGLALCNLGPVAVCDAAVMPMSCDAKRKLAQVLNDYLPTWVLDLPGRRDYTRDLPLWQQELNEFSERLSSLTGRRITRGDLRDSIELYHRRTEAFRALCNLRRDHPHLLAGRDFFLVAESSFIDDVARWTGKVWELIDELKGPAERSPKPPEGFLPVLLTGAPMLWPNWKLANVIEEAGATIVADTLCSGTQRLFDPVQVDEWTLDGMKRALALRYFSASLCPCFADSSDRVDRLLELAGDFNVRGIISHNLRLCQLFDMEAARVRQTLRQKDLSLLAIQTDYGQEDVEQVKTRVEAFLELLKTRG